MWFQAKSYGIGTGLPCAWQGWALMFGWIALLVVTNLIFGDDGPAMRLAVPVSTIAFFWIAAKHSPRSRWRWGNRR